MTLSRRRTLAFTCALLGSSLALACSALLDLEPPPDGASGPIGDGGVDGDENAPAAPACNTRYVSAATGKDSNSGCSPDQPLASIRSAIAAAEQVGAQGWVIKVAGGTYQEELIQLSLPGTVLGGFDRTFTSRSGVGASNPSILRLANASSTNKITVRIAPHPPKGDAAVPLGMTVIDGFDVFGADVAGSWAMNVELPGPVAITSCRINGADAQDSRALLTTDGAQPDVGHNTINGGVERGTEALDMSAPSAGMPVPGPHVHDNAITAGGALAAGSGQGSVAVSMAGIVLASASGTAFERNVITTRSASGAPAVGITVTRANVEITQNAISFDGILLDGESDVNGSFGIAANALAAVRISANRIYTGGKPGPGDFHAIHLDGPSSAIVTDNMIYAGERNPDTSHAGVAVGVYAKDTVAPFIAGNSIFTGFPGSPAGQTHPAFAIYLQGTTTSAVIENNILAGAGVNAWAIKTDVCPGGIAELANNLIVGQQLGTLDAASCKVEAGSSSAQDIAGMSRFVGTANGNVLLVPTGSPCSVPDTASAVCITDPLCTSPQMCLNAVFAGWDGDEGVSAFASGWSLASGVSCKIAKGGVDLSTDPVAPITTDYFGVPRSVPPAIGAAELGDGGCQ